MTSKTGDVNRGPDVPPAALSSGAANGETIACPSAPAPASVVGQLGEIQSLEGGRNLAHFLLLEEVGRGGMGTVYRARDTLLDRDVAVKVLSEDLSGNPAFQDRFVREAKIVARMNHPSIPQIHFIGRAEGRLFFAMEWIEGRTLESLAREGPLTPVQALDVARQAAAALRDAHAAGIVHRDIKPSNLMLAQDGRVKVLDFGIARSAAIQGDATATSGFIGTADYASPEQARGAPVDARSDIYSLGATLYHLLAGRPPFEGDNALAVLTARLTAEAPPLPPRDDVTPGIQALVARMLATRSEQRFPDAESLLDAIGAVSPVPPIPARRSKRLMAFLTDLLLVNLPLVALFVGFWAIKGYFITTPLYDSMGGRLLLGVVLLLWFVGYFVLLSRRGEATLGQRLQGIWMTSPGCKTLPLSRALVRTAIWWAPICLAMVLQPDWPIVLRSTTSGVEEDWGLTNLPWFLSVLWLIALGLMVLLNPNGRTIADWLSGTRIVERSQHAPEAGHSVGPHLPWRARLKIAILRPRAALNGLVLVAWTAAVIAATLGSKGGSPWSWTAGTIRDRHVMFEHVDPGDPGWDRLRARFLHEFLRKEDAAINPQVVTLERHPLLPYLGARFQEPLVVENSRYGARVRFDMKRLWALSGTHDYGGGTIYSEELTPRDEDQERQWDEARRQIYQNTPAHFLRALMHQRLEGEGFEVLNKEDFVGLFRKDHVFLLVAWPNLRVRLPDGNVNQINLFRGSAWVTPEGRIGGSVGYWGYESLPTSVLTAFAEEQDRAWGMPTASIQQVLSLQDAAGP